MRADGSPVQDLSQLHSKYSPYNLKVGDRLVQNNILFQNTGAIYKSL